MTKKLEYKVEEISSVIESNLEAALNISGRCGWELVTIDSVMKSGVGPRYRLVFKRRLI